MEKNSIAEKIFSSDGRKFAVPILTSLAVPGNTLLVIVIVKQLILLFKSTRPSKAE